MRVILALMGPLVQTLIDVVFQGLGALIAIIKSWQWYDLEGQLTSSFSRPPNNGLDPMRIWPTNQNHSLKEHGKNGRLWEFHLHFSAIALYSSHQYTMLHTFMSAVCSSCLHKLLKVFGWKSTLCKTLHSEQQKKRKVFFECIATYLLLYCCHSMVFSQLPSSSMYLQGVVRGIY